MLTYIVLAIIALLLIAVLAIAISLFSQIKKSTSLIQNDIHDVSKELIRFLDTSTTLISSDLHLAPEKRENSFPLIFKWIGSTFSLIKQTKEFIKNHEKSK